MHAAMSILILIILIVLCIFPIDTIIRIDCNYIMRPLFHARNIVLALKRTKVEILRTFASGSHAARTKSYNANKHLTRYPLPKCYHTRPLPM